MKTISLRKAWALTFKKWDHILNTHPSDRLNQTCGLCLMFNYHCDDPCKGCPLYDSGEYCEKPRSAFYRWAATAPTSDDGAEAMAMYLVLLMVKDGAL